MTAKAQPPNRCGECPATWWGLAMAHCRACHRTFTGVTAFSAHRVGPVEGRVCDLQNLVEVRPGVWGQPGSADWSERRAGVRE